MPSLFDPPARDHLVTRLERLEPGATRLWGKMTPAQALAHCTIGLEAATGDRPTPQKLIGRLLSPFIRTRALGPGPVLRGAPTDPTFVVSDVRVLAAEKARLVTVVDRFRELGPELAGRREHVFFGRLTGDEWGRLMHKHLDHHLRQFGA